MLTSLLIPLDGVLPDHARLSDCVLRHTMAIAHAFGGQVNLLQVLEQHSTTKFETFVDPLDWRLKKIQADLGLKTLRTSLEAFQISVQTNLLEGSTIEQSVDFIQNSGIDLVILCSPGQNSLESWNVARFAEQVLQRTSASILIVHPGQQTFAEPEAPRYRRILVPLDGSKRAESALQPATSLAQAQQAEIIFAHVVSRPQITRRTPLTKEDTDLINRLTERNQEEGDQYLKQLSSQIPGNAQIRLTVSDNVVVAIQAMVEQEQVDLLILSAHGYSGEAKWSYGSITNRFLADCTVPLLVVQDLPRVSSDSLYTNTVNRQPGR